MATLRIFKVPNEMSFLVSWERNIQEAGIIKTLTLLKNKKYLII